jgi:hypothetical protein
VKPLTDALQGGLKPQSKLQWSNDMSAAFQAARSAISAATLLAHPSPAVELTLITDASSSHVGAVLQQQCNGGQSTAASSTSGTSWRDDISLFFRTTSRLQEPCTK